VKVGGETVDGGPLISVIVPTFNSQASVGATLDSLAAQTLRDFEVVVCDGASRDDTLAIVQAHARHLPALHVDSQPDQGVYDAINRGIALARGQWVLVLGSDDRLHAPGTLAAAAVHLRASAASLVHGDVRMMAENTNGVAAGGRYAGPLTLEQLLTRNVCQQALFYRRSLFAEIGRFDLRYRLHADWDLNLRAAFVSPPQWIDLVVADYAATGMSATAVDQAFADDAPEKLRLRLLQSACERSLWPLHRRLLRNADALRRRGRWRAAARQFGTYLVLLVKRRLAQRRPD
jgi:glycosyltransferase involved in cell wall biosynthesis